MEQKKQGKRCKRCKRCKRVSVQGFRRPKPCRKEQVGAGASRAALGHLTHACLLGAMILSGCALPLEDAAPVSHGKSSGPLPIVCFGISELFLVGETRETIPLNRGLAVSKIENGRVMKVYLQRRELTPALHAEIPEIARQRINERNPALRDLDSQAVFSGFAACPPLEDIPTAQWCAHHLSRFMLEFERATILHTSSAGLRPPSSNALSPEPSSVVASSLHTLQIVGTLSSYTPNVDIRCYEKEVHDWDVNRLAQNLGSALPKKPWMVVERNDGTVFRLPAVWPVLRRLGGGRLEFVF